MRPNQPWSRGVTQLMYVGDDDAVENAVNGRALTLCQVGIAAAAAGLLTGSKTLRNGGALAAIVGFLAI